MNIKIDDIVINNRKRKLNNDKVRDLAESMKLIGQLEPIMITSDNVLLAGWHRVEAAKLLGWEEIKAELFEGNELERELVEIDENLMRNDLTVLEQGEHLARRQELVGFSRGGDRKSDEFQKPTVGLRSTKEIARDAGISEASMKNRMQAARNIAPEVKDAIRDTEIANSTTQLLELARLSPDKQIEVINYWDGEMPISKAMREIQRKVNESKPKPELPEGKYSVIYADPPWSYRNSGFNQSAASQYPTMSTDEICALDIEGLAVDDTVLFLWATSPLLPDAIRVIEAWGFEYKASMVWVKDKAPGMGWWINTKHELLLIACKGINHPEVKLDSVIYSPITEHSKKPTEFYEALEKMYPNLNKVELFARTKRAGWSSWGNEV